MNMSWRDDMHVAFNVIPSDPYANLDDLHEQIRNYVHFEGLTWLFDYQKSLYHSEEPKLVIKCTITGNRIHLDQVVEEISNVKGRDHRKAVESVYIEYCHKPDVVDNHQKKK